MTHEFQGERYPETIGGPTIGEILTGAEWDGWPLRVIGIADLIQQEGVVNYVWPHEGQFVNGKWRFHKGKIMDGDTEIDAPKAPLMVDAASARAFKLVYGAVNDKNKAKLAEFAQSRGLFCWAMDTLVWPNVKFGAS